MKFYILGKPGLSSIALLKKKRYWFKSFTVFLLLMNRAYSSGIAIFKNYQKEE